MDKNSTEEALKRLWEIYGIPKEESVLRDAERIRFSEEDRNAYAGVCLFLQDRDAAERWRNWYASQPERPETFDQVLYLAEQFLENERMSIQPRPKSYYEKIYADRDALFHHSPYALEEQLTSAVRQGNRSAALEALREISEHGEKAVVAKEPLRSAKNSMIGSIAFLARAAIQAGVNAEEAFALSDSLIQQVEEFRSRSAVLGFEEKILLQFIDLVNARLESAYSPCVTRAMHYIENNLDKKLRLDLTAAYVGVHPAYLSTRFKRETGTGFSAYVTRRKIRESTYFVRHSDYPVARIAQLYGFSSQSYFITSFRKVLGITPMEYRSRYLSV